MLASFRCPHLTYAPTEQGALLCQTLGPASFILTFPFHYGSELPSIPRDFSLQWGIFVGVAMVALLGLMYILHICSVKHQKKLKST